MSVGRDSIDPFRAGDKSLSASHQMEPLRMAATKGSTGENEISDATGIARRRGRRQSTTTYLVRATEQIDGYTISSGVKTVYSGLCQVLAVDTSDGTIDVSSRGNIIDVYNPFITIVTYSSADDNDFVVVKDKHGIYWVVAKPANAEEISCLVNNASGVAPTDATIAVDTNVVVWPAGATSPAISTVNNVLDWRIHDDNHMIWAKKNASGTWDAIRRAPVANEITFAASEAVTDTDTSFTVDTIAVMGEPGASAPTVSSVTITPVTDATASDNATGIARWDESIPGWRCTWLEYDCGA